MSGHYEQTLSQLTKVISTIAPQMESASTIATAMMENLGANRLRIVLAIRRKIRVVEQLPLSRFTKKFARNELGILMEIGLRARGVIMPGGVYFRIQAVGDGYRNGTIMVADGAIHENEVEPEFFAAALKRDVIYEMKLALGSL